MSWTQGTPAPSAPLKRPSFQILWALIILFIISFPVQAEETGTLATEHIRFYFSPPDKRLAQHLSSLAEEIYTEIVSDVGAAPEADIEIYLEHTHNDFLKRQPNTVKAPEWAAGLAYPGLNLIILKAPGASLYGTIDPVRTLRHELAHLCLHQALSDIRIPKWLNEGFAMYQAREWTFRTTAVMTALTLKKKFIPLSSLKNEFPISFEEAEAAYALSFSMVAYLLNHHGREDFHHFLSALNQRKTYSESAQSAFGLTAYELEKRWHRHLRLRYTWIPVITSTAALWFLASIIFLLVYLRKKHLARQKIIEWELEEMWENYE